MKTPRQMKIMTIPALNLKKNRMKKHLMVLAFISAAIQIFAQDDTGIPNSEIEVIKDFNARLAEAHILHIALGETPVDTNRAFIRQYKLSDQPVTFDYAPPRLKPLAMPKDELEPLYRSYAKVGYGLQKNPFVEVSHYVGGDNFKVNAFGSYESLKSSDIDLQTYRDIQAGIKAAAHATDILLIRADIQYLNEERQYYGQPSFDRLAPKFSYSIPQLSFSLENAIETRSNVDYGVNYTYRNVAVQDVKENTHIINGLVSKKFEDGLYAVEVHGEALFNQFNGTSEYNLNNYVAGIKINYNATSWYGQVGIDFGFLDDVEILPQAKFKYVHNKSLQPFVGVKSFIQQQNLHHLSRRNPYLNTDLDGITNRIGMSYYAGTAGETAHFDYEFKFGYTLNENYAQFVNAFPDTSLFNILNSDINEFTIGLKASTNPLKGLHTGAELIYHNYSKIENERAGYHLPQIEWMLFGVYHELLRQKLSLRAELVTISGIRFLTGIGTTDKLGAQYIFNLSGVYTISEHLSGFVAINNLLDNRKPRYFSYDGVGINPRIGLTFQF